MTASQLARLFHAKRAGKGKWRAVCPIHGGKHSGPLSITQMPDGARIHCFGGCETIDVISAIGLSWKDVLPERAITPEIQAQMRDEDELHRLDARHGAYILNQTLDSRNKIYWRAAELGVEAEICALKSKLYPDIAREDEVQRIIAEYGFDELWECIP